MKGNESMTTQTHAASGGPGPGGAEQRNSIVKVVFASLIGTAVEWYDFFLYGSAAAIVFGALFFPEADPVNATLLAFGTYAVGFVARPLGGIVFGHFGDRVGRKKMLVTSLLLMGVATFAIGLLPTYATIGIGAPILLLACRLVQGFAVGGEWGGAVLMAAEHGEDSRRGFWSSWPQAGVALGNLFATGPGGVLVISPQGRHLGTISTPEVAANCGWGDDGRTLYAAHIGTPGPTGISGGGLRVLDVSQIQDRVAFWRGVKVDA